MGIFTWTDAAVKDYKLNKYDDYYRKDVVEYGGYAKLICPDNSELETQDHNCYGTICGYDIYELVAEWNKDYLSEDNISTKPNNPMRYGGFYDFEKETMKKNGMSDHEIEIAENEKRMESFERAVKRWEWELKRLLDYKNGSSYEYMSKKYGNEWLREIGIDISCEDKNAIKLMYPIKMNIRNKIHGYENLYISYSTQ